MKYLKIYEDFNNDEIISEEKLLSKLKEYNIPVEQWGTGSAKNVRNLYKEVQESESILKDEGGYLVRYIQFVGIRMYYTDANGRNWVLKEDRQEFKDGRIRRRKIHSSVSEKMKYGEDPIIAAVRGIEEELGIRVLSNQLEKDRDLEYDEGSVSYPGLRTRYSGYKFNCTITDKQYEPRGYIERQEDKSTFFKWVEIK
jgi:hypothetical protein